ncbi:major tail protein [uncultured Anoxybacillus sp.]|uniref:major tail protein n=1 Tax=uncultured Anoxybacillus sp. TaxID=263860 RepID=UPI0026172FF4|nr:major tail protein [uncultured Anoxybacillus sp.]
MPGVQVGLRDLYYAILKKDDSTGVAYQTPVKIAGAINAKISPKVDTQTLYADDVPSETFTSLGEIEVELETKDLTLSVQAALLGHKISNGVLVKEADDVAPYVAIGFRSQKSNGKFRYVWLTKGRFETPEQEYQTKEDKPSFQTPKLKGTFVKRDYDGVWQVIGDEEETGFNQSNTWFNAVVNVTADTTPPTLSNTVPANNATSVAVSTTVQWIFSEAISPDAVNASNFMVIKDSDGSVVAGTLSQSADKTTITFTPSANLSAATAYRIIATTGVQDLAGNSLVQAQVRKFTTA